MKNVRRLAAAGVVGAALMVTMLAGPASAEDTGWGIAATGTEPPPVTIQDPGAIQVVP